MLVENGCIVDARAARIPTYTPAPCAPVPGECGEGGGSAGVTLSPDACNLLEYQSGMLLSKLYFGGSSGVTVTGPQQHAVATGKLTRSADNPTQVTVPVAETLRPGEYTVAWHVVSVDGHKTKGQYTFSVK